MPEKLRIKSLSTRWLLPFKITVFILYTAFFASIIFLFSSQQLGYVSIFNLLVYGYWFYILLKMAARIKYLEFDDDYIYVLHKRTEVMIPLENIKFVEIKTLGGVYRVELYYDDIVGRYFYFKPSLLYPLSYKKKDKLVDLLREKIEKAKKNISPVPVSVLASQNS